VKEGIAGNLRWNRVEILRLKVEEGIEIEMKREKG
jgi:hypothetical protein